MASRFWVLDAGTWDASDTTHWSATSGGTGGASVPGVGDTVTFDASSCLLSGTVTVNTNFSVISLTIGAFTGTLDFSFNNNNPTLQTFSGTGSGVRTLKMGSGTWAITSSGTCWDTSTATNLTLDSGSSLVNFTYAGASSRTITSAAAVSLNNIRISAGSGTTSFPTLKCNDFIYTSGYTGAGGMPAVIMGSMTLATGGMTIGSTSTITTFSATSGTKTLASNGVSIDKPITFDGVGGTWQLIDDLSMGSTRTVTLTNGAFDANNKNVTCGVFASSNANTRTLAMGTGVWTLTGTGTIWSTATSTNLTLISSTSTIVIADTSNTANTFAGGGKTFNNIWWNRGTSTATNTITGSNTFNDFKDTGTAAHSLILTTGTTTTVSTFPVSGNAGKNITLASSTTTNATLAKSNGGTIQSRYMTVDYITGTPSDTWFMGSLAEGSVDGGHNVTVYFNSTSANILKGGSKIF